MIGMQGSFIYIVLAAFGLAIAAASGAIFLGCIANDVKDVTELSTLLFIPQILFAGFFIRTELIPVVLRWAQYLCSLKYCLNLVLLTEFSSSNKSCQGTSKDNCAGVLKSNNIATKDWWIYMLLLIALFLFFRVAAAYFLVQRAKKFY
jgi:hypothetical protein